MVCCRERESDHQPRLRLTENRSLLPQQEENGIGGKNIISRVGTLEGYVCKFNKQFSLVGLQIYSIFMTVSNN
jgi:hypothetical protein